MMITIPDVTLIAASAACGAAIVSLLSQRRQRRNCTHAAVSLQGALERHEATCSAQFAGLRESTGALEASFQSTRDVLRHGRLSRSSRAQALHLLRSGMSPDTAATTLGIAKREMRLLAKVSELLSVIPVKP